MATLHLTSVRAVTLITATHLQCQENLTLKPIKDLLTGYAELAVVDLASVNHH